MSEGSIRAIVIRALHDIIPANPTIYGVYRLVKEQYGTYDYKIQLDDVRHAVNVFRTTDAVQDWDYRTYLPRYMLAESDRVHQGNYRHFYKASWQDKETGEITDRMGSFYSSSQMTEQEIRDAITQSQNVLGNSPQVALVEIQMLYVLHRRGAPYAEGAYLAEL